MTTFETNVAALAERGLFNLTLGDNGDLMFTYKGLPMRVRVEHDEVGAREEFLDAELFVEFKSTFELPEEPQSCNNADIVYLQEMLDEETFMRAMAGLYKFDKHKSRFSRNYHYIDLVKTLANYNKAGVRDYTMEEITEIVDGHLDLKDDLYMGYKYIVVLNGTVVGESLDTMWVGGVLNTNVDPYNNDFDVEMIVECALDTYDAFMNKDYPQKQFDFAEAA